MCAFAVQKSQHCRCCALMRILFVAFVSLFIAFNVCHTRFTIRMLCAMPTSTHMCMKVVCCTRCRNSRSLCTFYLARTSSAGAQQHNVLARIKKNILIEWIIDAATRRHTQTHNTQQQQKLSHLPANIKSGGALTNGRYRLINQKA